MTGRKYIYGGFIGCPCAEKIFIDAVAESNIGQQQGVLVDLLNGY